MHELKLSSSKPHRKSAQVVGEVLAKLHPHGGKIGSFQNVLGK